MPRISLARLSSIAPKFNGIQRAVTSRLCYICCSDIIRVQLTRNTYFLLLLMTFVFNVMAAEGFFLDASGLTDKKEKLNDENLDSLTKPFCIGCLKSQSMALTTRSQNPPSDLTAPNSCFFLAKKLRHLCGKMTLLNCYFANKDNTEEQLPKKILQNFQRCAFNKNFRFDDSITSDQKKKLLKRLSPGSPKTLSRQKRLAQGDRRLVFLLCQTSFVLLIKEDGKVIGSREKSSKAILEIQTTGSNGRVRFYSPSSGYYLAMNRHGKLFGTKNYHPEDCDFVERLTESFWSTYSLHYHSTESKQNHIKWYIALNRKGKPRRATRTNPRQHSTHFLPRPV